MDGKELIEASGSLSLGVFGFFYLGGNFAFTKTTDTVTLSDGTSQPVSLLTVGASNVNAFAGINGPYILSDNGTPSNYADDTVNTGAIGLSLHGVNFGLAMMSVPQATSPGAPAPVATPWGRICGSGRP